MQACSNFTDNNLRQWLWPTVAERNDAFGYSRQQLPQLQKTYNDNWKHVNVPSGSSLDVSQATKDYYFNMSVDPSVKSVIGFTGIRPNLYNDNLQSVSSVPPNNYRSWEPFSTTANPVPLGTYVRFIPHAPVEVAPVQRENYWTGDLNGRLYERSLIGSAVENPYANFYARQGMLSLLAQNMRVGGDTYTKPLVGPKDAFAYQAQHLPSPPPVTNF